MTSVLLVKAANEEHSRQGAASPSPGEETQPGLGREGSGGGGFSRMSQDTYGMKLGWHVRVP